MTGPGPGGHYVLERMTGIEPAPRTWNARVPPQHFIRTEPKERFELSTSPLREGRSDH